MDETRHVASWIGGQEALHDRVLTLEEALAAIDAVDATAVQRVAATLFRDDGLRLAAVAPARYLRGLERHLRLPCMTDRVAPTDGTDRPGRRARAGPRPPADSGHWRSPGPSSRRSPDGTARRRRAGRPGRGPLADRRYHRCRRGRGRALGRRRGDPVALAHRGRGRGGARSSERGAPTGRSGAGARGPARSTRSSPACRAPRPGRPMRTNRHRPRRLCSTARSRPSIPAAGDRRRAARGVRVRHGAGVRPP